MSAAAEVIEETNATIGAAMSTGGLPSTVDDVLAGVQRELLDLAEDVTRVPPGADVRRLAGAAAELPRGFAVLAGFNGAAGLLKVARAAARRASRTVSAGPAREYLEALGDALLVLAFQTEEHEQARIPVGFCVDG